MKKTRVIEEYVCDHCEGTYEVKRCSVCNTDACGNHYMWLYEHDFPDRPRNSFIMCYKCIAPEIMKQYVEVKRHNSGNSDWGKEWVS